MNAGHKIDWTDVWWSPVDRVKMLMDTDGKEYTYTNLLAVCDQQNKIYPPRLAAMVLNIQRNGPPAYFERY